MGYLHNISTAAFATIFALSAFAVAPPLFYWHNFFEVSFLSILGVDYFVAAFALLLIYLVLRQHFSNSRNSSSRNSGK